MGLQFSISHLDNCHLVVLECFEELVLDAFTLLVAEHGAFSVSIPFSHYFNILSIILFASL